MFGLGGWCLVVFDGASAVGCFGGVFYGFPARFGIMWGWYNIALFEFSGMWMVLFVLSVWTVLYGFPGWVMQLL